MEDSYCKSCKHHKKQGACDLKSHYPDTYRHVGKGGIAIVRNGYEHAKIITCQDYEKKDK